MDPDIKSIYEEAKLEVELNHQIGENHQSRCEEAILNLAALRQLDDDKLLETLGN